MEKSVYSQEAVSAWNRYFYSFTLNVRTYKECANLCKAVSNEFSGKDAVFSKHLWGLARAIMAVYESSYAKDFDIEWERYVGVIDLSINSVNDLLSLCKLTDELGTITHYFASRNLREDSNSIAYLRNAVENLRVVFLNIFSTFENMLSV